MSLLNDIYNESPTKAKSRLKIIENAFSLFAEEGFELIGLAGIADKSGITIRNLYRYYSNKESLITDVAYHYVSMFNSDNKIVLDNTLNGYEQMRDLLENQIEYKMLTKENHEVLNFIAFFDIYMTKQNIEHDAIKNYNDVYAPILKENLLESTRSALTKGVGDNTINIKIDEVDYYVAYIYNSLMSLVSRDALKRYEKDIQNYDFIHKHIDVLLQHLKK